MGGFGDLFGALGDLLGGGGEEGIAGAIEGALVAREVLGGEGGEQRSATATYDRRLAGARRELNVNDR